MIGSYKVFKDTCPIITMPRTGPDEKRLKAIKHVLKKNPQGLWIREIARQSGISKSTVHFYINSYMAGEIEDVLRGKGNFIRIVRLK